jgi:hypothetical protein
MGVIWNIFIDRYWVKRAGVGSGWEKSERWSAMTARRERRAERLIFDRFREKQNLLLSGGQGGKGGRRKVWGGRPPSVGAKNTFPISERFPHGIFSRSRRHAWIIRVSELN